jgi:hypothetical protein
LRELAQLDEIEAERLDLGQHVSSMEPSSMSAGRMRITGIR